MEKRYLCTPMRQRGSLHLEMSETSDAFSYSRHSSFICSPLTTLMVQTKATRFSPASRLSTHPNTTRRRFRFLRRASEAECCRWWWWWRRWRWWYWAVVVSANSEQEMWMNPCFHDGYPKKESEGGVGVVTSSWALFFNKGRNEF